MQRQTLHTLFLSSVLGLTTMPAFAGNAFGTDAEARALAAEMIAIITDGGVDAAIDAMHDASKPFVNAAMGVHVFEQSIIVADNREPELIASSYVANALFEPADFATPASFREANTSKVTRAPIRLGSGADEVTVGELAVI